MATVLSVNLNKIALLRNSRGRNYPQVEHYARECLLAGAGGVTIHPRPDQRHATYQDVASLKAVVEEFPGKELNIEGNPVADFLEVVLKNKPDQCTLVPDQPDQLTSDHGWELTTQSKQVVPIVEQLKAAGIRVSLFMDPVIEQIELAKQVGADRIELYTEGYARAFQSGNYASVLEQYKQAADYATSIGLEVNAGHDLDLQNLAAFLTIPNIKEVSIGHALIVESIDQGFTNVIKQYLKIAQ
ncbi:pyridoxine 5'-phosphate synthase [Endozoicomonas sp. SM1973]|uniref:Pyridoxine 5'-phosphate synthase n=1 Tax=Spartinivicinus marinus TaxID=2994442 RepID=A0A853ILE1_9GAMM|nr:pyridoxine 5'-phosphate synthase [Spartinivicinus marinus]MCX4027752.1 pyridoxine 5'-phosphate synthase [Spartinivicinus marinus]NYZ68556.1 pyridoxine 5'-phosphate synthase [Spartinivicinus marinus]